VLVGGSPELLGVAVMPDGDGIGVGTFCCVGPTVGIPPGGGTPATLVLVGFATVVGVMTGTGVGVCVGTVVAVTVGMGVSVGIGTGVLVGIGMGVSVGIGTGVLVGIGMGVSVGIGTGVLVGIGMGVSVGTSAGVVAVGNGVDVSTIINALVDTVVLLPMRL